MLMKYYTIILQEMKMSMNARLRYKVGVISDIIVFVGAFILAYYFKNHTVLMEYYQIDDNQSNYLFYLGFVFWQFGSLALGFSTSMITTNASSGLLELQVQGYISTPILYFFKLIISILTDCFIIIIMSIFICFVIDFDIREFLYILYSIIWNIPNIIGMYGFGLIISAITLKEKKVSQFILLVQTLLLFLTNIFHPISKNFMYIVPYTSGIELLRNLYVGNGLDISFCLLYIAINFMWVLLGSKIFNKVLLHERTYGSFDTY